ncbi:DUF4160 domain-containing protein [Vibrio sp. 10N]|uniref:DUF4160 domain-containing protein n=1 Tax=Vibrio sp. 10N TaxID=3058938 RepID=UPI0028131507|nr:hypothetical protein VB10N_43750 [Vibrio sp. 10N]
MGFPKDIARERGRFHKVDPSELLDMDEYAEWLSALLYGQCYVEEFDGELCIIEIKHLVSNQGGVKIEIFSDEHPPPHFHVKSGDIDASFSIEDCSVVDGTVRNKELKAIKFWHNSLKQKLIEVWNETRPSDCTVGLYQGT